MICIASLCSSTHCRRVLLVCLLTPLPIITVVFLQESVPLQNPEDGWSVNYGLWVRSSILIAALTCSMTLHASHFGEGVVVSPRQLILLISSQALGFPVIEMAVAACWVFPIPFMNFALNPAFMTTFAVSFRLICGEKTWGQLISRQAELFQLVTYTCTQLVLAILYPLHQILFNYATGTVYELPVILLLPIVKIIMKNLLARTVDKMQDIAPEAVIFTVNLFNALYIAMCMQGASSPYIVVTTMIINLALTGIELHDIFEHTKKPTTRLGTMIGNKDTNLLDAICSLCKDNLRIGQQERRFTIVHSTVRYDLSKESQVLLIRLESAPLEDIGSLNSTSPTVQELERLRGGSKGSFISTTMSTVHPISIIKPRCLKKSFSQDANILNETLELFFTTECIVLTEYLESIIPVMNGLYSLANMAMDSLRSFQRRPQARWRNGSRYTPTHLVISVAGGNESSMRTPRSSGPLRLKGKGGSRGLH